MTTLDDIDTPYPLKDILPLAYPNGGMTLSGLRKEIARGNLVVEYTAGKFFVTMRAILEMREKCRVQGKARASGSVPPGSAKTESSRMRQLGSSSTANKSPQDALRERLLKRSKPLPATSKASTSRAVSVA